MHILALNCGSSSLKSALVDCAQQRRLLDIRAEGIGAAGSRLRIGAAERALAPGTDLAAAVDLVVQHVREHAEVPDAVVHRVVHGGERFTSTVLIDDEVLREIEELQPLAPLHNPPAVAAIRQARAAYPLVPQVAVFDTAYHSTLPPQAREYALPKDLRQRFGIRRYGFHGISHAHVAQSVAACMDPAQRELRIISCHLGNGASVTAIEQGRSVDTSMGMTPLAGLVMGTRAGDLDPGILLALLSAGALDQEGLDALLNRRSGLVGLTGTNDVREIEQRAAAGDAECTLAVALYARSVRKYIGAYAVLMGGVDAIAFTAGVGENSAAVREQCLTKLEFLGVVLDSDKNRDLGLRDAATCIDISAAASRARLFVVRADEELAMAMHAAQLLGSG